MGLNVHVPTSVGPVRRGLTSMKDASAASRQWDHAFPHSISASGHVGFSLLCFRIRVLRGVLSIFFVAGPRVLCLGDQ